MEIELEPSSERFDPLDERWLDQIAQFITDVRRDVGEPSRRNEAEPGKKGAGLGAIIVDLEPIILTLGSTGAFAVVTDVIRAFISRDSSRTIRAKWYKNGKLEQFEIRGTNVDDTERLLVALQQAAE